MDPEDNPGARLQRGHSSGSIFAVPEEIAARVLEERRMVANVLVDEFANGEPREKILSPETNLLLVALASVAAPVIGFLVYKKMSRDYALFLIPAFISAAGFGVAVWAQQRLREARERAAQALRDLAGALDKKK